MASEDMKKYKIFENILQKVNKEYIALPDVETKRNNKLLEVIDRIIQKIRLKDPLFDNLFSTKFYGGSFYDNLKVGKPNEYDLDCLLSLPKFLLPTVEESDQPGYVLLTLKDLGALEKKKDEAPKWEGIKKLLDGNDLSTKKVRSWMESLVAPVLKDKLNMTVKTDEGDYKVQAKFSSSGPAMTIKLDAVYGDKKVCLDVDLVLCFIFNEDHWPKEDYRVNTSKTKKTFFVVPKSPSDDLSKLWRLSFQEQERELISSYNLMKPTIRLIKKIRDRHKHKISSYYIKTIFLWELSSEELGSKEFWSKSLSFVFMTMLKKYADYLEKRNIPYFWNEKNNLIGNLPDVTVSCIANCIRKIASDIDRTCLSYPYGIVDHFLSPGEVDLDTIKNEVPLSKKQLRQMGGISSVAMASSCPVLAVEDSGAAVSALPESGYMQSKNDLQALEAMCLHLMSDQKRVVGMLEDLTVKVNKCETAIEEIREKDDEVLKKLDTVLKRLDDLDKEKAPIQSSTDLLVDDLLDIGDRLQCTLNFSQN